ncbi:3-hydroxyacyl-CoA dehydrogenase NAD-binding domain-containing protein [Xanthobacteraceae bacterium A53D]
MKLTVVGEGALARGIAEVAAAAGTSSVALVSAGLLDRDPRGDTSGAWASIAKADWIFEISAHPADRKRAQLQVLSEAARPEAILTTDESIVPLKELLAGAALAGRCIGITHVFAPPSHMKVVEVVAAPADLARIGTACAVALDRRVLAVPDTPGFVANRIGFFWTAMVMVEAQRRGLGVAAADAVAAAVTGTRIGIFALADFVGLDVMAQLDAQLRSRLAEDDPIQAYSLSTIPALAELISRGALGRATGAGFYRKSAHGREGIDLANLCYADADAKGMSPSGGFARAIADGLNGYARHLSRETGLPLDQIRMAMELGYGWTRGID